MTEQKKMNRKVMAMLLLLGHNDKKRLVPDSDWGPSAEAALGAYQEEKGLKATGEIDKDTFEMLNSEQINDAADPGVLQHQQCALILLDCATDELVADGEWGTETQLSFEAFMVKALGEAYTLSL